jgi:hypothetical protein
MNYLCKTLTSPVTVSRGQSRLKTEQTDFLADWSVRNCYSRDATLLAMAKTSNMAETLFARALELSGGALRIDFVAKECAHDSALRREVESLLAAHNDAGGFLQLPA